MGARKEDYLAVAPPNSFIHVDDFNSPEDLAKYLHMLNQNDHLYNRFFAWKGTMKRINTKFYCRLCSMVHAGDSHKLTLQNAFQWWIGDHACVMPKSNDQKWLSWKD